IQMCPAPKSNTAPVARNDDHYMVEEGQVLSIDASGILSNDSDADEDDLTARLVNTTTGGTLTLRSDGSFTYTPNTGFTGEDFFTYVANDGQEDSNVATVTITVTPGSDTNTAPVATNDHYTVEEGQVLSIDASGVLGN